MAVADAVCRMVPGVLPEAACYEEESHWNGLLEYPQYSRPEEWHGRKVPEILLSGHHAQVNHRLTRLGTPGLPPLSPGEAPRRPPRAGGGPASCRA